MASAPKQRLAGLCWFAAACLAVTAFILVLVAIAISAGVGWSLPGFALLVSSAAALAVMAGLISVAFRIERRNG